MNFQEMIEFLVRMSVNSGRTKEEAWDFALKMMEVRS